jgi:hypothetical protein
VSTVRKILDRSRKPAAKPRMTVADEAAAAHAAEAEERFKRKLAELEARAVKAERSVAQAEDRARKTEEERDAERVRAAIVRAAKDAMDPDEIADLLHRKVSLREGKIVGVENPEHDVDAVVKAYLDARPHHVRAQVAQGTGAPPITGRAPTPPAPTNHDRATRDGATAAFREALMKTVKQPA